MPEPVKSATVSRRARALPAIPLAVWLLVVLAAASFFVRSPYVAYVATLAFCYAFATSGLNIIYGFAGQPAFGHPVFFGVGAYASAILVMGLGWPVPLGIVAAGFITAVLSILVAATATRLRGSSFAMVTLALTSVAYIIAQNWIDLTNGPMGIRDIAPLPALGTRDPRGTLLGLAAFLALAVAGLDRVLRSPVGRAWVAVRENEALAASVGIAPVAWRIHAFVSGAFLVGIGGALYVHTVRYLDPTLLTWNVIAVIFIMLVGGGSGTLLGPILGAFIFGSLPEVLRVSESARDLLLGLVLVLTLAFMPEGLVGLAARLRSVRARRAAPADASTGENAVHPQHDPTGATRSEAAVGDAVLEIDGVAKSFGGLSVLTDVSFTVREREILGVVGPNGAGKTTLFNIVTGFLDPSAGAVRVRGRDITGVSPTRVVAAGVCRTFQITSVFPTLTVAENIRTAAHRQTRGGVFHALVRSPRFLASEARVETAVCDVVRLTRLAQARDSVAANLSYGEQRLLEVAVALATGCDIVLLDEPAAGLNASETELLRRLVLDLRDRGITLVIIEHDMHFMSRLCDRIVVLHRGGKLAEGKPEDVLKDPQVIEAYLGVVDAAAA